jgi:type I restriction enzyme S subunit
VLRIPNIASGRIDLTDLKFAGTGESLDAGDELAPGDLLIIRTNGSKNLIGRSAVVRDKLSRATGYASYLIRFRLFSLPTLFDWIATIWDVSFLRAWIEQRAATSAGQYNISMSVLSTMPIPLPPLAEQTRIVAEVERRLSVVEELESVVSANLQRATRLRQSILQKAFTGELLQEDYNQ